MWTISKQFEFDYGHRVWSQTLNEEYSIDNRCVCRHLHGHRGFIEVHLSGSELKQGMVTDFKHLNWLKKFVDEAIDHKFILDRNDPLFSHFLPIDVNGSMLIEKEFYAVADLSNLKDHLLVEWYESFVIVDFVPTSEMLSQWLFEIVSKKMNPLGVTVSKLIFKETPKTQSIYEIKNQ